MVKRFALAAIFLVSLTSCSSGKVVDLEFEDKTIGAYRCRAKDFKITDQSSGKPFNSFEFDKWYKESDFIKQFRESGESRSNAESAYFSIKAMRGSGCS